MNTSLNHEPTRKHRAIPRGAHDRIKIVRKGHKTPRLNDLYVLTLSASWKQLIIVLFLLYMGTNVLFACAYLALGNAIENAQPGSFADAFFFSVQTLSTVGYGKLVPSGIIANLLVTGEVVVGFAYLALITGLVFSKFARPTAHLLFSQKMVICPYNGTPHLMMRLANRRNDRIVDAKATMTLLRRETTQEGEQVYNFHDLKLERVEAPFVPLSWVLRHPIDTHSPLHGITKEKLFEWDAEIIISICGLEEVLSQSVTSRYSYLASDIVWGHSFVEILKITQGKRIDVNYHRFHDTQPHETRNSAA